MRRSEQPGGAKIMLGDVRHRREAQREKIKNKHSMHFGKNLLASRHEPWSEYYLDYGHLKGLLEDEYADQQESSAVVAVVPGDHPPAETRDRRPSSGGGSFHWNLHEDGSEFLVLLNREVEKIFLFFLSEQGQLATEMSKVQREIRLQQHDHFLGSETGNQPPLSKSMADLATHLLRLIQYVDLNLTAVRKILKKHDKLGKVKLTAKYLGRNGPLLQPLLSNESLDGLIRVYNVTLVMWNDFQEGRDISTGHFDETVQMSPVRSSKIKIEKSSSIGSVGSPRKGLGAASGHGSFSLADLDEKPAELILYHVVEARKRLQKTNEFVQVLAASMMVEEGDEDGESIQDEEGDRQQPTEFSNFLNLMSTFLYMSNYYVCVPSSDTYAIKLGSNPSIAGMIIGMTPVAALVSTLLYSWWTSYSYKSALIFASTCSLIGNLLYAAGLPYGSLTLVMLGRILNGFGSARSINRRYIADTFSRNERTAASAAFVTAGALGMAAGPAVASLLNLTVSQQSDNLYWQAENSPGWFMFGAWSIYLVCLVYAFTDPPKRHHVPSPPQETGEKRALLAGESTNSTDANEPSFWDNTPTFVTFFVYFVLKLALESILSSSTLLTKFYFKWTGGVTGFYMAGLGLLMLPANLLVASLSQQYDDRQLIRGLTVMMLLGCLAVVQYTENYSVVQYVIASITVFVSTNALEGPNMSLLSKTIPHSWTKGFFNVGLLATEAGTLGRAVGDVLLTVFGSGGIEYLVNMTFGTMASLSFASLLLIIRFYRMLDPKDKDD
eukprot:scaffold2046_cov171-Amphora_coffeaeformis.AAC.10